MDYKIMSVVELDAIIEEMESKNEHDALPSIYDQIVELRNEKVDPWSPSVQVT